MRCVRRCGLHQHLFKLPSLTPVTWFHELQDDDDHEQDGEVPGEQAQEPTTVSTAIVVEPVVQAAQIVTVSFDDVSGEATVSSADVSAESSDAGSVMMVMGVPLPFQMPQQLFGGVKHACSGMRQAAGQAVEQLRSAIAGAGAFWVQQDTQQQQQQHDGRVRGGRAGMMGRMMGPADDAHVVQQ